MLSGNQYLQFIKPIKVIIKEAETIGGLNEIANIYDSFESRPTESKECAEKLEGSTQDMEKQHENFLCCKCFWRMGQLYLV